MHAATDDEGSDDIIDFDEGRRKKRRLRRRAQASKLEEMYGPEKEEEVEGLEQEVSRHRAKRKRKTSL